MRCSRPTSRWCLNACWRGWRRAGTARPPSPWRRGGARGVGDVTDHLPKHRRAFVDRRLAKAFNDPDPDRGLRTAQALARQLEADHPDAAASLREGLEQMFTVRRLGVSDRLARTLSTTNAIESMISIARDTTRNVKHWRDGKMIKRWCAAGMLNAERSFRRLKGHKDMPVLVAALRRHAQQINQNNTPVCDTAKVA